MRWARRSSNWTSFSSPWARVWDGHEVVDLAVGRLALHYAEENPDEVLAALDDKTEAVIRELEASTRTPSADLRDRHQPHWQHDQPRWFRWEIRRDPSPREVGRRSLVALARELLRGDPEPQDARHFLGQQAELRADLLGP